MKVTIALLLAVGLMAYAVPIPGLERHNVENDITYSWPGTTYEVEQNNIGFVSISESVDGADSVGVWFDVATATYDYWDVWVMASITGEVDYPTDLVAYLNWYDNGIYTSRTGADTLNWVGFNSGDTNFGTLFYTMSVSGSTAARVASLVPGETLAIPIPFRCQATSSATDSTGYIFEVVTTDSCEVNMTLIAIPRT